MRQQFRWTADPREFQLEGTRAQLEGVDIMIQAPTGCGKTAVAAGPHVWSSSQGKITIVISPLLALEEEMVHTFQTHFGLKAIAVHNKNGGCSPLTIKKLLTEEYQILLISPEMMQSRSFMNRVLRNSKFANRVLSMVVDEAHCISHWGADFRKKYGTLDVVRAFLPRSTSVVAMTATLTARTRRDIHTKLQFVKGTSRFINVGNDRPNVSMVVRSCEHPLNTYADLDFVIPTSINSADDIPKTWIYADNISTGTAIIEHLREVLQKQHPTLLPGGDNIVRPFNAVMSLKYRRVAMDAFRKGDVRIMVCTDAAGMGCDIPDIDIVVQWKLPKTFSNWIQRAGRVARGKGRTGIAVLLVERSMYSIVVNELRQDDSSSTKGKKQKQKGKGDSKKNVPKDYSKSHGINRGGSKKEDMCPSAPQPSLDAEVADEGLLVFVQSSTCRRKVWAKAFETYLDRTALTVPCCDICDPSLFDRTRPGATAKATKSRMSKRGQPVVAVVKQLKQWRRMVYKRDHPRAMYDSKAILDDTLIASLSSYGPLTRAAQQQILAEGWIWWDRYSDELSYFIETLGEIPFIPIPPKTKGGPDNNVVAGSQSGGDSALYVEVPEDFQSRPKKRPSQAVECQGNAETAGVLDFTPTSDGTSTRVAQNTPASLDSSKRRRVEESCLVERAQLPGMLRKSTWAMSS
ncbi:P-loop containing nucleoside triphosphate hydrolase protein [Panus rudis PR-1116 ss-1]|nr:P-loop containing nucleoside triphosphate hydrolase protein [Panus rudis PR-1116 ss-1]